MSVEVDVATAVVAFINTGTYTPTFTAALDFDPTESRHELSTLVVSAFPATREPAVATRTKTQESILVAIGVRKQCAIGDNAAVIEMRDLTEAIYDKLRLAALPTYAAAHFDTITVDYSWDALKEDRTYLAVINVTYKVWR